MNSAEFPFGLGPGKDIDWEKAWDEAETHWDDHDPWSRRYLRWLINTGPVQSEDGFQTFLRKTGNEMRYDGDIRRAWKAGLLKSVLEQVGKAKSEAWIQQLIDEQAAKRRLVNEYAFYLSVLDDYREQICRACSRYAEEPCSACKQC